MNDDETPFVEFERRVAAAMIDVAIVFFFSIWLMSSSQALAAWLPTGRPVLATIALLYFAVSWASPLSATPAQWALRFKIVSDSGSRLGIGRATFRAVLFIVGVLGVLIIVQVPEYPWTLVIVLPSFAAFCIALFTANRQGLHDLATRSVAVRNSSIRSESDRAKLQSFLKENTDSPLAMKRPKTIKIVTAAVLVLVVSFGIYNAALVRYEMELRARISYAYAETSSLRDALEAEYRATEIWQRSAEVLGTPTQLDYPDGGYFALEDEGVVRIRFTKIPKLMRISLIIEPEWDGDTLTWNCRAEGDIASGVLPARCRD